MMLSEKSKYTIVLVASALGTVCVYMSVCVSLYRII